MKVALTIYVHPTRDDPESFHITTIDGMEAHWGPVVYTAVIEFEVNRDELVKRTVENLRADIQKLQAQAFQGVAEIQQKIDDLLALPHFEHKI